MRSLLLLACLLSVGCGGSDGAGTDATGKTQDELCSAAVTKNADGTATMYGCAYENHVHNIMSNGVALEQREAHGADGSALKVTNACGRYLFGADDAGVSVIIDKQTGEVQSHGQLHQGEPVSDVVALALPISLSP